MEKYKLEQITERIYDGKHGDCDTEIGSGLYFISVKDLMEYDINYKNAREITKGDFIENYKRTCLENGDTIYANTGDTIGKSIFVKENSMVKKTSFQKSVAVIKPNRTFVDDRYLYYLLKHLTPALRKAATGSAQKNLLLSTLRDFKVTIHKKCEQTKISNMLGVIDDKIRNNMFINLELEKMSKTMYDYWFSQYEFPNDDGKPYKSSGGKMVWNDELKKDIPESWTSKQINEIVDMVSGYSFSTNDYNNDGKYKLYTIKNVQDGIIVSKVDNKLKDIPLNMSNECILKPSDILMSLTGNVGRVGLVYENNVLLNQRLLKLVPKYNDISYIYLLFRDNFMRVKLEQISTGTSQKNLSPIDMGNLKIAYPDKSVLEKFTELNNNIIFKIVDNFKENQELTKLRNYLLPLLMNGQVGF